MNRPTLLQRAINFRQNAKQTDKQKHLRALESKSSRYVWKGVETWRKQAAQVNFQVSSFTLSVVIISVWLRDPEMARKATIFMDRIQINPCH